ncbi:unnamed protein product [Rotaria sp. Silwood1]|nr:unnamed protein product [Rotaria sp. Silwood1]CAF3487589.1 unnamed protein product [Rotaria sp. Silwood1]CAF3489991.1 unnamed protein product [Rotaria sp. Silwood1]CAF4838152.1 unnamed protein product [Rotaria sp. Silwood1]CAF4868414.1 unnamed protein product [Rotaria sp. Silwood1]
MSSSKHTGIPVQPGSDRFAAIPDEISCVFRFGKNDHYDPFIEYAPADIIEKEENSKKQADNIKLSAAAYNEAIMNIKNQLKLSSSLQVHSSDGSLISVFNSESTPSASSTYTNLEPSLDLPIGDTSFIQQILDNTTLTTPIPNFEFDSDLFDNIPDDSVTFDQLLDFDPTMTIQTLTDVPMEQSEHYSEHELSSSLQFDSTHDETTISSVSSQQSDYSEHDDTTQRKTRKSGGPAGKLARFGNKQVIKYSDEYHSRRVKNNEAVKKSRMKAKEKQKTTEVQMNKLTDENRLLNDRVDLLMQELQVLRSLYKGLKQDSTMESGRPLERIIAP